MLQPQRARSSASVVRLERQWYVACDSRSLGSAPLRRDILGTPLCLFRGSDGRAAALLDRCPHRNVPLTFGKVIDGELQCGYHGWRFNGAGACLAVPGLCGEEQTRGRAATIFPSIEQDGFVWVFLSTEIEPEGEPFRFPHLGDRGYTTVRRRVSAESTLHAAIENALDVPHTAFLHGGLFRTEQKRNEIEAVVRVQGDRVEAEYLGEPRPTGIAARILSPSGGMVTHFDRFILPSIAQVEYALGSENHFVVTTAMTPVSDFETVLHAVVSYRLRLPNWLVRPFLEPVAKKIFRQDAEILRLQAETIQRFGGEDFISTEIDILGRHIWKLMRQAAKGEPLEGNPPVEQRVRLLV